jgi:hypothetical protein
MAAGCGESGATAYRAGGKVVFADGAPLTVGNVEFRPTGMEPAVSARGRIHPDGTFQLSTFKSGDGALEGEHQAMVSMPPFLGAPSQPGAASPTIDPRFTRFETSGLKFTVTKDAAKNQFVIEVARPSKR